MARDRYDKRSRTYTLPTIRTALQTIVRYGHNINPKWYIQYDVLGIPNQLVVVTGVPKSGLNNVYLVTAPSELIKVADYQQQTPEYSRLFNQHRLELILQGLPDWFSRYMKSLSVNEFPLLTEPQVYQAINQYMTLRLPNIKERFMNVRMSSLTLYGTGKPPSGLARTFNIQIRGRWYTATAVLTGLSGQGKNRQPQFVFL